MSANQKERKSGRAQKFHELASKYPGRKREIIKNMYIRRRRAREHFVWMPKHSAHGKKGSEAEHMRPWHERSELSAKKKWKVLFGSFQAQFLGESLQPKKEKMISSRNEDRVSVVDLPCEDQQNKSGSSTSHSLLAGLNLEGGRHYKRAFVNHQDVNPVLRNRQK